MVNERILSRTAERVSSYIQRYVHLAGAEQQNEVLDLFDKMHQLFPQWVIMTCPVMHPGVRYVSPNCAVVFGHSKEYLVMNSNIERYFSHVHDADKSDLHNCFAYVHDHLETVAPAEHNSYRNVFHYRFKRPDGKPIYLHDEKASLAFKNGGHLYYTLFRDLTTEKNFSGVKVELFKQENGLVKIAEYKPTSNMLTKREGELVALIKQGFSTKEIAWYLQISHNTVRNIKSRLFEKFNVNNTIELLNMTA